MILVQCICIWLVWAGIIISKVCEHEWFGHAETVYFFKAIETRASMVGKEHKGDGDIVNVEIQHYWDNACVQQVYKLSSYQS